jgi:HlyD family secretion protein
MAKLFPPTSAHQAVADVCPPLPRRRGFALIKAAVGVFVLAGGTIGLLAVDGSSKTSSAGPTPENKASSPEKSEKPEKSAGAQRTADLAEARRQAFEVTTTCNGELEARKAVELRSQLDQQTTIQFIAPEGIRVKAGDLLCKLNSDQIQQKIDETKPRLASARAEAIASENEYNIQINDNTTNLRKAELKLAIAQIALEQWRQGDVAKKRQEMDLKIDKAKLELERLAEKFARSQKLLIEGFISKDECDKDEGAYIQAISDFNTTLLARDVYEKYEYVMQEKKNLSDVEDALAEQERVRLNNDRGLASKQAKRENAVEQVKLLEAQLAKFKEQVASTEMKAPQDGLVVYSTSVERNRWGGGDGPLQIGQQVYPNQLIIVLPDTSEMLASVRVHESLSSRVKKDLPVRVKIDAAGGRVYNGKVESIGVIAESDRWRDPNLREYVVKVGLNGGDGEVSMEGLKPSMRAEATIVIADVPETLTIPVQSLFSEGPVRFVYVPQGKRFIRQPVKVGQRSDTVAEIVKGLDAGDWVLLREPAAGEVIASTFTPEQLAAAGYDKLDLVPGGKPGEGRRAPGVGGAAAGAASGAAVSAGARAAKPAQPAPVAVTKADDVQPAESATADATAKSTEPAPVAEEKKK